MKPSKGLEDMTKRIPEVEEKKGRCIEMVEFAIICGVLLVKKVEVIVFADDSEENTLDEAHIITTFYVDGIETKKEVRVFYCFDREFWMEEPEEIVKEMYPEMNKVIKE